MNTSQPILERLAEVLQERKQADADSSYVAGLYAKGLNKILEKVGEEATEMIIAAKDYDIQGTAEQHKALVDEAADLWFHSLVALGKLDISHSEVLAELERRFGLSGLEEKHHAIHKSSVRI